MIFYRQFVIALCFLLFSSFSYAARLAIVIDDFGYRQNTEEQILQLPVEVTIAIFPNSPLRNEMISKAKRQGREMLIHMPMAPLGRQPLEKDTLFPDMSEEEITRIMLEAIANVPDAKGMNNHMGSAMTSDLAAMQKVMKILEQHNLYFLDSMTIARSQGSRAAEGTNVKVLRRNVFLDDNPSEAAIRQQFDNAIRTARRNGSAIAIGHPHPSTVRVLQQMLPQLPPDVILVTLSNLLDEQQPGRSSGSTTDSLPIPDIIDIPLDNVQTFDPANVSAAKLKQDLTPCPIELPENLNIPSQFAILFEALEARITALTSDSEAKEKEKAHLYIP